MSLRRPARHQHLPSYSSPNLSEASSPFRSLDSPDPFITARQERDSRDAHGLSTRKSPTSAALKNVAYWLRLSGARRGTWIALGLMGTLCLYMLMPGRKPAAKFSWAKMYKANSRGWVGFTPAKHLAAPVDEPGLSTPQGLSYDCLDAWVARGALCDELRGEFAKTDRVDALYTWVNGTDPIQSAWYTDTMSRLGRGARPANVGQRRGRGAAAQGRRGEKSAAKHFR